MPFQKQIIESSDFSAYLKKLREQRGVSLELASTKTGISLKYLAALEAGDFQKLPGVVYAKNFFKIYVTYLGGNLEEGLRYFEKTNTTPLLRKQTKKTTHKALMTPRRIEWTLAGIIAVILLSYFVFEVRHLSAPPAVEIFSPKENEQLSIRTTAVDGRVGAQVSVVINGEIVNVRPDGTFHAVVDLQEGLNTITIQAVNKKGKTTVVERRIAVKSTEPTNTNQ